MPRPDVVPLPVVASAHRRAEVSAHRTPPWWRSALALTLAALALVALPTVPRTARADGPEGGTYSQAWIDAADGTRLHAAVFRPAHLPQDARTPVVLAPSVYYGLFEGLFRYKSATGPVPTNVYLTTGLLQAGYTVVAVDVRGAGASGGCLDYAGDADAADVRSMVEWAAQQPWSTGAVALAGNSFDGAVVLAGMRQPHPALRAAFVVSPLSPYSTLWTGGIRTTSPLPFKPLQGAASGAALDLVGPPVGSDPTQNLTSVDPGCTAAAVVGLEDPDPSTAFWRERDVVARLAGTRVPTLLSFGFEDSAAYTGHLVDLWRSLAGPRRAWFGQFAHIGANDDDVYDTPSTVTPYVGRRGFQADYLAFLDEHLRGGPGPVSPRVIVQEASGGWRGEGQWPPASAADLPWTVRPGTYVDGPGNTADRRPLDDRPAPAPAAASGRGTWTFSQPLPRTLHLTGEPRVDVQAQATAPGAHLVALLYDVAPDGTATVITRGASLVRDRSTAVRLFPQDWQVAAGHRVGLLLTGADDTRWRSDAAPLPVRVTGGSLALPVLRAPRAPDLEGGTNSHIKERRPFVVPQQVIADATVQQPMRP